MVTILTHQSVQYQGEDVLVINGEKTVFSGTQEQLDAQKIIRETSNPKCNKRIPRICKEQGGSTSLKVFINDSGKLVVSSNYQNKDEKGRYISYNFYCDSIDNPAKVVRVLADDSQIAGMTPNPADIKTLNNYLTFYKNRVRNYAISGAAAIVFLWALIKFIL